MKQITVPIEYRGKIIGYSEWCAVPIKHKGVIVWAAARRCFTNIRSGGDSWCELQVKRRHKTREASIRAACRLNGKEYVKPEPTLMEIFWRLSGRQREVVYRICNPPNYFKMLIYSDADYDANIKHRPSKATIRAIVKSGLCFVEKVDLIPEILNTELLGLTSDDQIAELLDRQGVEYSKIDGSLIYKEGYDLYLRVADNDLREVGNISPREVREGKR